jgi:2-desacetyl-2-hydroxyethyl bacteriochlorophyllide A dehydrogenase
MKGIMFVEEGQAALIDEEMPECTEDTMLLRTLYSGLSNGTERNFLVGGNYGAGRPYPKRIAYQQVSEVVACGDKITRFKPGDVVFVGKSLGHVEYRVAGESDLVTKLPDGFDLEAGALLGVAAVSYHDAKRARTTDGDNAIVFGDGPIGQFAAQAARALGATVTMVGHHDDRLAIARDLGADYVINSSDNSEGETLKPRAPYPLVFECSGADVLDQIIGAGGKQGLIGRKNGARVVLVAGRFDVTYNFNAAGAAEVDILHTTHFEQEDLEELVGLVSDGTIRIRPIIKDVVRFSDAVGVFDTLRDNKSALFGTVFDMAE